MVMGISGVGQGVRELPQAVYTNPYKKSVAVLPQF